ncbi:glutathione S-transferase N-terminal domain-containing protein [Serpentinimonas barnesii]|uniref:glutathione S-transferase N-terminal domain-containing protein n=1 Tax=Serpentinimonas barnesii TaxID=1458427 RepID=UPI000495BFA1|nr:glutathione S-transferase N-terminal domain-containing protein [Serpentinimonas barnesii]
MKLIGSLTSPYVRKARIVLAEKKLNFSWVDENVWAADTRIQQFNPLGKVPCLLLDDGTSVYDSRVIVEYLDTLSPVGKLIPDHGRERLEVKIWEALADGVSDAAFAARMEGHWDGRTAQQRSPAWIERQLGKVTHGLRAMSERLGEQPFCHGTHFSLADVATGCALAYLDFRFAQIAWRTDHPNLARLYEKLAQRPSFVASVPPG